VNVQEIFICPKCGGLSIEEVTTDAVVAYEVVSVTESGEPKYNVPTIEDGSVDRYECASCGHVIPGVSNSAELYAYLLSDKNKWQHTHENCEQLADQVIAGMPAIT